jgi:cell division protein FtsZ
MIVLENEPIMVKPLIKVIGVGGAGGNAVNSMIEAGFEGIEFIAANTDAQALQNSRAQHKVQLGNKSTKGLGAGANPQLGRRAAEEDIDRILDKICDTEIVFLIAGAGGGTGSGASPVIAQALKEKGILTIGIVTKPFTFEGRRREAVAYECLNNLQKNIDTLIVIPNQKLLEIVDKNVSMIEAFSMINDVLVQSVRSISEIITKTGHINLDFADLKTIMKDRGLALMGTGRATGPERAIIAANNAINAPLLDSASIKGAQSVLLNITGGLNITLHEINDAASIIYSEADPDAHIILGSVVDPNLTDEIIVTVIATGFNSKKSKEDLDTPLMFKAKKTSFDELEKATKKPDKVDLTDLDVPTFLRQKEKFNDTQS